MVAALVDTNVLVYRYDPRYPEKQRIATDLLDYGIASDTVRLPHQAIVEFVSATTRPLARGRPLLSPDLARQEADELLSEFTVLFPNKGVVRTALRGAAMYGLSWFDAHLWALRRILRPRHSALRGFSKPAASTARFASSIPSWPSDDGEVDPCR
jgi:predicted nucleic acid-binding protein